MGFYFKIPPRIRLSGDRHAAKALIGWAKKQFMWMEWANVQNLQQIAKRVVLPDGSEVNLVKRFGLCEIDIFVPYAPLPQVRVTPGENIESVYFCVLENEGIQTRWNLFFLNNGVRAEIAETVLEPQTWAKSFIIEESSFICAKKGDICKIYNTSADNSPIYELEFDANSVLRKENQFCFFKNNRVNDDLGKEFEPTIDIEVLTLTDGSFSSTLSSTLPLIAEDVEYPTDCNIIFDKMSYIDNVGAPYIVGSGSANVTGLVHGEDDFVIGDLRPFIDIVGSIKDFDIESNHFTLSCCTGISQRKMSECFTEDINSNDDFRGRTEGEFIEAVYDVTAEEFISYSFGKPVEISRWSGNGFSLTEVLNEMVHDIDANYYSTETIYEYFEGWDPSAWTRWYEYYTQSSRTCFFDIYGQNYELQAHGIAIHDYNYAKNGIYVPHWYTPRYDCSKKNIFRPEKVKTIGAMFKVENEYINSDWREFKIVYTEDDYPIDAGWSMAMNHIIIYYEDVDHFYYWSVNCDNYAPDFEFTLSPAKNEDLEETVETQKLISDGVLLEGDAIEDESFLDNRASEKENDILLTAKIDESWAIYYENKDYKERVLTAMGLDDDSTIIGFGLLSTETRRYPTI